MNNGSLRGNGVQYDNHIFVNWQLAGQEIGNNRSLINWQAYARFNGSDSQLDNGGVGSANGGGMLWSNGGRVKNYEGNLTTRNVGLASGSFWINHNNDGTASFELSCGLTFYQMGRSSAATWFGLPTIPRNAVMTTHQGSFNDEQNPFVEFSNPGGFQVNVRLEMGGQALLQRNGVGSRYTWNLTEAERDILRNVAKNNNSMSVRTVVATVRDGSEQNWDFRDNTFSVINANPTFTDFTYKDSNPATVAVTGNDQWFIQGYSTLQAFIASANKATALKKADMVKYNFGISSISVDENYATTDITKELGVLNVNTDTPLVVKAIDTRGNNATVSKTLKVLPYGLPQLTPTVTRVNNFETQTKIKLEGSYSRLTVADVDKNEVLNASGIKYRYKKTTDTAWSAWTNLASTGSGGNKSVAEFTTNFDRNYAWNLEFSITDKINTVVVPVVLSVGIPLFRIGLDGKVYNNEQVLMTSHVGQVIMSTTLATAQAVQDMYGGTWVIWATGRVPVGVDTTQTEFDTVEKTGGAKTQTTSNAPSQQYPVPQGSFYGLVSTHTHTVSVLQPYITCYFWKRTA